MSQNVDLIGLHSGSVFEGGCGLGSLPGALALAGLWQSASALGPGNTTAPLKAPLTHPSCCYLLHLTHPAQAAVGPQQHARPGAEPQRRSGVHEPRGQVGEEGGAMCPACLRLSSPFWLRSICAVSTVTRCAYACHTCSFSPALNFAVNSLVEWVRSLLRSLRFSGFMTPATAFQLSAGACTHQQGTSKATTCRMHARVSLSA